MSGRPNEGTDQGDAHVAVDAALENEIAQVEEAVDSYLTGPTEGARQALTSVLETLDEHIGRSDDFHNRMAAFSQYGLPPRYAVFGEADRNPVVQEVPGAVLRSQIELVKAAKNCVRVPNPSMLDALRLAHLGLSTARGEKERT